MMAEPPPNGRKNLPCSSRSINNMTNPAFRIGSARITRKELQKIIQVNNGSRRSVMPGAL
jgi:hypothetical protein